MSPLRGEKPIFGKLSKCNTGMAALRAGLPVITPFIAINTCGRNSLYIDSCNTTIGLKSIKYKGPKLWNELPSHLKYCNSTKKSPFSSKYIFGE